MELGSRLVVLSRVSAFDELTLFVVELLIIHNVGIARVEGRNRRTFFLCKVGCSVLFSCALVVVLRRL